VPVNCQLSLPNQTRLNGKQLNNVQLCSGFPPRGLLLPCESFLSGILQVQPWRIREEHLKATPLLRELHLYGNHLRSLSPHLLRGVPLLQNLDLTENKLRDLPADVFSHAPLRSLVLKNNLIEEARGEWLPENSSLTWLDLSGNLLTKIPTVLLQKLPNLENLDLSNNRLEKIPPHSLDGLAKLERLNLQENKLHSLDASSFQGMHSLTVLTLAHNKLSHLPGNLFQGLTRLTQLSLDGNEHKGNSLSGKASGSLRKAFSSAVRMKLRRLLSLTSTATFPKKRSSLLQSHFTEKRWTAAKTFP
uniref:Uncharacterized protein n=1 Tax=Oryzias melastigma TaxID=30732 RepID=A0A3B3BIS7_ORYME